MIFVYAASCVLFATVFVALRVWPQTDAIAGDLRASFALIGDSSVSDREKELALRAASLAVLGKTIKLTLALAASLGVAALPVVIAERADWLTYEGFVGFSLDPWVLVATIVVFAALARFRNSMVRKA